MSTAPSFRPMPYDCEGCGESVPDDETRGSLWATGPLGMVCWRVHRVQSCARAALAKHEDHVMLPGNRPPLSKEEKAALAKKKAKA